MAIKVGGTTVVDDSRQLTNIASVDATTVAALGAAGVGGGGGTFEATASGSISSGDPVVINADGTVSIVGQIYEPFGGTPVEFQANQSTQIKSAYDPTSNKFLFIYGWNGTRAVVGTVSGTSISFGSAIEAFAGTPSENNIVFDSNAGKFVLFMVDPGNTARIKVATVSGTSVSVGSETTYTSNRQIGATFDSNSNKVIYAYQVPGGNDVGYARVGTVSGTSISFGSATQFEGNYAYYNNLTFDSNLNKVVIAYKRADGSNAKAVVGTVSGTSISFGTPVTFDTSNTNNLAITFDSNSNKVVIAFKDNSDSKGYAIVGTVSGTSISFGTRVLFHNITISTSYPLYMAFNSNANQVIISYKSNNDPDNEGYFVSGSVSGTSISFETPTSVDEKSGHISYDSSEDRLVIGYSDYSTANSGSGEGHAVVYGLTATDANKFIGMSDANYSNSETVTVQTVGSVNESQTGLTAGEKYYVIANGVLSTTPDERQAYAGIAVSATKIIVKG